VNIRGVFLDRLREQGVDQADDRCFVIAFPEGRRIRECPRPGGARSVIVVQALQHLHCSAGARFRRRRASMESKDSTDTRCSFQGYARRKRRTSAKVLRPSHPDGTTVSAVPLAMPRISTPCRLAKGNDSFPLLARIVEFGVHGLGGEGRRAAARSRPAADRDRGRRQRRRLGAVPIAAAARWALLLGHWCRPAGGAGSPAPGGNGRHERGCFLTRQQRYVSPCSGIFCWLAQNHCIAIRWWFRVASAFAQYFRTDEHQQVLLLA